VAVGCQAGIKPDTTSGMSKLQRSCIAKQNDVLKPVEEAIGLDLGDKDSA